MKIILHGKNAKLINFFFKMLKKDDLVANIIDFNENINIENLINLELIRKESENNITNSLLMEYINKAIIINNFSIYDKTIDCNEDIESTFKNTFNILYPSILYETHNPNTIEWTLRLLFNRNYSPLEMNYHIINNKNKNITMFEWFLILYLCPESYYIHDNFWKKIDNTNLKSLKLAVIFCGHVRSYNKTVLSKNRLINNPNIDIFIHTWDDFGYKNNNNNNNNEWLDPDSGLVDIQSIKVNYQPKKIKIENNKSVLNTLSFINKINPIFLFASQARDDASKYINSQLYSIYQAYKLVEEYEQEKGFKYDGILKLRFDFNIKHINLENIFTQITQKSTLWFAHANLCCHAHHGGGGGCLSCDNNIEHSDHTNDICDILFYGDRECSGKACELFLHGENILKTNTEKNINILKMHPYIHHEIIDNYVYIYDCNDIENKFLCYYPEALLRRYLKAVRCLSSLEISGEVI